MNKIIVLNKNNVVIESDKKAIFYSYNKLESVYIKDSKTFLTSEKEKTITTNKYLKEFKQLYNK